MPTLGRSKTSAALNVSHTFGQVGRPPNDVILKLVSKRALRWAQEPQTWHADAAQCPEGALAAVDLVISDIDRALERWTWGGDVSEDTARTLAGLRHALAQRRPFASMQPWRTQDLMVEHVPRLYGLEGHHRCHGSSLRIYMRLAHLLAYQLPQYAYMLKPVLRCSQKMSQCSASVHLHRWLMSGSCRTESPEEADLFYFPAYEACYNETACSSGDTERCFPQSFDPEELPFFHRRGGQDHIFVFACNLLPFMDLISIRTRRAASRNSIMVTVESFQAVNVAGPNMLAWLVYSKDVLIPGYIPAWRVSSMVAFCRPMIERTILATFHGHSRSSEKVGHMYKRSLMSEVRDRIISYFGQNSCCSAGPPVRDYFRRPDVQWPSTRVEECVAGRRPWNHGRSGRSMGELAWRPFASFRGEGERAWVAIHCQQG
eukprot:g8604.t2